MKPAIVLSTNKMGLGVIRGLGVMGVPIIAIYYDRNEMGYLSRYVKERIYAPHPERFEDQFVDFLKQSAARFGGSLLIPTDDATLATVSRHKSLLEDHYIVACTEWATTEKIIDKKHTYALAEAVGVPAPKTMLPESREDLVRYDQTAQYPCLVKPVQGHRYFEQFKTKMVQVDSFDQMLFAYRQAADAGFEVMLQELIPGDDTLGVNYNSYFWDGEALAEFTAQQVRNGPPEFGSPRVVLSKHIPEVIEPGRRILQALGFYGFSCTEFKMDPRDGVYKLMEVNGRHNRSSLLAIRCGINFPWLQYQHLIRGELPSASEFESGVYWSDIVRDLGYSLKYLRQESYSLRQYAKPYREPHVFANFDPRDPAPIIKEWTSLLSRAVEFIRGWPRASQGRSPGTEQSLNQTLG
jgi:predicted ATP-grasp superfamily ATP-dependent carboligase